MADRRDYDDFVLGRSPRLLRLAYLITRDWATAQDLLQTALVKSWFAWRGINGDPEPYVRKIMVNSYVSWTRRLRWREVPTGTLPDRAAPAASPATRLSLWDALGRLPKQQRAIIVLRYFEDLSHADIARTLGCRVGTVKSQTSRALAKLRADTGLRAAFELPPAPAESPAESQNGVPA